MLEQYSVLMSVYCKEQPEYLRESLMSMLAQTVRTDDLVLICDGPLTEELDQVIEEITGTHPDVIHVHRLPRNEGLAKALNVGLGLCKHALVARMDSDDIALPQRCQLQLEKFEEVPSLSIVGGAVDEFERSPDEITSHKDMPQTHEQVMKYASRRNPFNHPTVMYRKQSVLEVGGYPMEMLHEDYALWAKMLMQGAKGCNLPQTLCLMRTDSKLYARRGGWKYLMQAIKLRWGFYRMGFYSGWNLIVVVGGLIVVCLVPVSVRKNFYRLFLRNK